MTTIARYDWTEIQDGETVEHKNDIRWDAATGGFAMCDGQEAYAQTIEAVVKTVQGELITRRNYGIPYFTTIFSGKIYADEWADAVQEAVKGLNFVLSLDSFEYEYDDKRKYMTYKMSVTTMDGNTLEVADLG